ncbi:class I SAM-dependent methyltransferase [Nostoc sp. GT001]|uniref:class I SAM-dependent methyltransferase n=1 Tax=Nostoc sp. GT001 TaxID=3056647 RepID=UPI0025AAE058|nr:class I SAM-dependent methyltransferase [Nostoc sp. GT001]MDM9584999.1 class I SAM-dependent methyltransferase [Nostoc sp. GT001]
MFDSIIKQAKQTEYDFRKTTNPEDPLLHLFDEWIDYYKLKSAIAHELKPLNILEIGVRFGYSAAAFLHGYPNAKYTGIDLDTNDFGGVKGAINWAKEITKQFNTEFIIADTQVMKRLPGNVYDLIHVDGQQNGDGSFHDLELAIKQSRYVLVDGYMWTQQNFMAVSDFLFRYADLLDWYGVIPGYAGELLIKVSNNYLSELEEHYHNTNSSLDIRQSYTSHYYTQDCSGFDTYKQNQGKKLEDPRLQSVAAIASLKASGRVLDIGSGRGELSYYFARQGFAVTSIDYSPNAIELAKNCFNGEAELAANVEFICDHVCNVQLPDKYDLALASDVIEHLAFEELDVLYQQVAHSLKQDGLFVVHTFPNLWYYKYEYPRKRKIAASVGAYLPPQPRSRYELLMHINEQSPRILKKQLSKHFNHVCLWFGDTQNPGGSLVKKFSTREIGAATSLFVVASHRPINREHLKNSLQMFPIPPISAGKIKIFVKDHQKLVNADSEFEIKLEIENSSEFTLNSYGSHPLHISYHWMNEEATDYIVFEGQRTKIFPPLNSSEDIVLKHLFNNKVPKETYKIKLRSLAQKGSYILRVTLVQEGVRWFDLAPTYLMEDIGIRVI